MNYQVEVTHADGTTDSYFATPDAACGLVASEATNPTPDITKVAIRAIASKPVELTSDEAQALAMLVWRYMDPNTSYAAPDVEALRTANNRLVTAFGL